MKKRTIKADSDKYDGYNVIWITGDAPKFYVEQKVIVGTEMEQEERTV